MEVLSARVLMAPSDFDKSRYWYEHVLGLRVYREFGDSGVVAGVVYFFGGGFLELSASGSPAGPGITLWLQVNDLGTEWRRLQMAGARVVKPPTRQPWGLIESWVEDPDGTRLVLVEVPDEHPIRRRLDTSASAAPAGPGAHRHLGPDGLWVAEHPPAAGGPAPLVVLVHGAMDRGAAMARVVGHLRDLHVVRYDRRGYGRSWPAAPTDLAGHAGDLVAVLDGRPAAVVGHSFGGSVALAAAVRRPDLVLAVGAYESPLPDPSAPPAPDEDFAATGPDAAEAFLRRMIGDANWEALPPGIREARRREGPAFRAESVGLRTSPPAFDPHDVTVPVVAGNGSRSDARFERFAEALVAATAGDLLVLEGADHGAHLGHPALFAQFVRQVVRRAGAWPV